jgi:hypothetical protein
MNLDPRRWWRLTRKVNAYKSLEGAHGWEIVCADLADFCNYTRPTTKISPVTASIDPVAMAQAEGRREVFLRIKAMMDTNDVRIRQLMHAEMMQQERLNDLPNDFEG